MPAPDPIITVVREWLVKADHDLLTAAHPLPCPCSLPVHGTPQITTVVSAPAEASRVPSAEKARE
jgi:hypothetical protein